MNDGKGVEIGGARGAVDPLHNYWGGASLYLLVVTALNTKFDCDNLSCMTILQKEKCFRINGPGVLMAHTRWLLLTCTLLVTEDTGTS